jgi:dTDP-L-rhamnose 4-epimerase
MNILVTGGAGFIGSHIVDALLERGHEVRVYDSLDPQVHPKGAVPAYLSRKAEFIQGDLRDRDRLLHALKGVQIVFHQAAAVGVGQSMYQVKRYVEVNSVGGATLLDILANERHSVEKVIVASSMSIYGEGYYTCSECGDVSPKLRPRQQLIHNDWELHCPNCGITVFPRPTLESKVLQPTSIYAITKRDHEEMFLCFGRAYGIPTVALRYFNVYGPRQALSNPYTGVAAIFSSRLLCGNAPLIYEDGRQSRDFVHVLDIVQANLLAMEREEANYEVFNVGTGKPTTVLQVAKLLAEELNSTVQPEICHQFREGDIRHCYADITRIRSRLGYQPRIALADGIAELVEWVRCQSAVNDGFNLATKELLARGLVS